MTQRDQKGDGKFDIFTVSCYFIAVVEEGSFRCSGEEIYDKSGKERRRHIVSGKF